MKTNFDIFGATAKSSIPKTMFGIKIKNEISLIFSYKAKITKENSPRMQKDKAPLKAEILLNP